MFATIQRGLLLLLGLLALGVLAFNSFAVEPTLRAVFGQIRERTGTAITFTSATGNLLTGKLALNGAKITREVEGRNAFALEVSHLSADVAMLRLTDPEWRLDALHLLGAKGEFAVVERKGGAEGGARLQGGQSFSVDQVLITDARLHFVNYRDNPEGVPLDLAVTRMEVAGYRSRWSLYDLLYQSTLEGTLDGEPLRFTRQLEGETQKVTWELTGLPASKWRPMLGGAAAVLAGPVDTRVVSHWPVADPRTITMDFRLQRRLGGAALEFTGQMPRGNFEGAQSLQDAGLYEVVREGLQSKALGLAGGAVERVGSALDAFRRRLSGR